VSSSTSFLLLLAKRRAQKDNRPPVLILSNPRTPPRAHFRQDAHDALMRSERRPRTVQSTRIFGELVH